MMRQLHRARGCEGGLGAAYLPRTVLRIDRAHVHAHSCELLLKSIAEAVDLRLLECDKDLRTREGRLPLCRCEAELVFCCCQQLQPSALVGCELLEQLSAQRTRHRGVERAVRA